MPPLYKNNTTYWQGSSPGRISVSPYKALAQKNISSLATSSANRSVPQTWNWLLPADFQSLTNVTRSAVNNPTTWTETQFPVNQPIWEPFPERYKNLTDYRTQTWESLPTQTTQPWYTPETPTTRIANMPGFLWGGQYLTDPNSNNVANERSYIPEENKAILGWRDSRLYQIDHVIPLWAGGADTIANKEVLTTADHAIKSKIQAVPFTLMAKGLISPQEAKNIAINWQGKDASWIPDTAESWWFMDTALAQQKYKEWNSVRPVTLKDVLKQVPEVLKSVTAPLSAKTWEDDATQFIKSMAGWFLSEASMGVLPYQQESTDMSANAWAFVGKIAGTVASFATLEWIIGKAWEVLSRVPYVKALFNSGDLFKWAQLTKEGILVSKTAGEIWEKIPVLVKDMETAARTGRETGLNNIIKKQRINNVLKSAWLMTAYGQIRITAPAVFGEEKYPDIGERLKQAGKDMVFWGIMWSAGNTVKWYAGVWAGTAIIWLISGDNAQNAALDGITMMALHGLSHWTINKQGAVSNEINNIKAKRYIEAKIWEKVWDLTPERETQLREKLKNSNSSLITPWPQTKLIELKNKKALKDANQTDEEAIKQLKRPSTSSQLPTLQEAVDAQATQAAKEHITNRISSPLKLQKINLEKLDSDWLVKLQQSLQDSRDKLLAKWKIDLSEISKIKLQDDIAVRQLEKWWMGEAERKIADAEDVASLWEKLKNKEQLQDISTPDELIQTIKNSKDDLFNNNPLPTNWNEITDINLPVGQYPLTGIAWKIEDWVVKQRALYFLNNLESWNAIPKIFFVERSELTDLFTRLNKENAIYKNKEIKNNEFSLMQHPENSIQAYGVVKVTDPQSQVLPWVVRLNIWWDFIDVVPTWWWARYKRIAGVEQWGHINSFNQNAIERDPSMSLLNPDINKDPIAQKMRENWLKILSVWLDPATTPLTRAGEPFILTNISRKDWSDSLELNKRRIWEMTGDNMATTVQKATVNKDPQAVTNVIKHIQERNPNVWSAKITKDMAVVSKDPDTAFASDVLTTFEDWLNSWSATKLKDDVNKKYWPVLDDNTALQLMANKQHFTPENAFDVLYNGIKEGKANVPTAIMYQNNLMPLFEKINTSDITINWIPANSFYTKMPVLPASKLILSEEGTTVNETTTSKKPVEKEKNYEKFNTFSSPEKQKEFEDVKQRGADIIDNFEIKWQESDSEILKRMQWEISRMVDWYKWSWSEKQQAKDLLTSYWQDKIKSLWLNEEEPYVSNSDDYQMRPSTGLRNKLWENIDRSTPFKTIYPDIYNPSARETPLGSAIAANVPVDKLVQRASRTNKNSLANDLQESMNASMAQNKPNVSLLWKDVLKEFDRLGKSSDWRNKEIDTTKFNENMKKVTNDIVTTGDPRRIGTARTVDPIIANYEMDINIGRTDNLPEPLKLKYEELQKEGYGHVYSSSSMNTKAYKWRTSGESSYNMFKYIKAYASGKEDQAIVKEIYGDKADEAKKAIEVIKTWRLGDDLTLDRLGKLEQLMYGDKKPNIAKAFEERNMYMNRGVGDETLPTTSGMSDLMAEWSSAVPTHKSGELIEAWLSPIALDGEWEMFNNPLSHAIMSLSKYNINELTPEEISKLSKSVSYTLWPVVKNSLKEETHKTITPSKKNDGKWWPGAQGINQWQQAVWNYNPQLSWVVKKTSNQNNVTQALVQWAQDFSQKTNLNKYLNLKPTIDRSKTIMGRLVPQWPKNTITSNSFPSNVNFSNPNPIESKTPSLELQPHELWHAISMAESSEWANKTNKDLDQGEYWYVVGFTKWTYNDIKKMASKWDARYKELLSKLNFDTPDKARQSALAYFNFRNTLYNDQGQAIGKKYNNSWDAYVNLYNASWTDKLLARKNWDNVIAAVKNMPSK